LPSPSAETFLTAKGAYSVAERLFELAAEVRWERDTFRADDPNRRVTIQFLGIGVGPLLAGEGLARGLGSIDIDSWELLQGDERFRAYARAYRQAARARRQLAEREAAGQPEREAITAERTTVKADLTLSGAALGDRLGRLDAREAELGRATDALRAGLAVLEARATDALPAAQAAERTAKGVIRSRRTLAEEGLRRRAMAALAELADGPLRDLGSTLVALQALYTGAPFEAETGLLQRLAAVDEPPDAPAVAAAALAEPAAAV
jgi:hypothetical protein